MAAWSTSRTQEGHALAHRSLIATGSLALAILVLVGAIGLRPPAWPTIAILAVVAVPFCGHWLAATLGWHFVAHAPSAYLQSWTAAARQQQVLRGWRSAALAAGLTRRGNRPKTTRVLLPDAVTTAPRGVVLLFFTPTQSDVATALAAAAPVLAAHLGEHVATATFEGGVVLTVVNRDPLATPRRTTLGAVE